MLLIIADTSGSMYEMGKIHIQKNLCRYVHELQDMNRSFYTEGFRFYQWADEVSEIPITTDGSIEPLTAQGCANLSVLAQFLLQESRIHKELFVLILSDGNVDSDGLKRFRVQMEAAGHIRISAVAVGADSDRYKLAQLAMNGFVYAAEDIDAALHSLLFGSGLGVAPLSAADFLPVRHKEAEDSWDAD